MFRNINTNIPICLITDNSLPNFQASKNDSNFLRINALFRIPQTKIFKAPPLLY